MHRVLRPGGTAVIQDMNREATEADIRREVDGMRLNRLNALATRFTLAMLRRRAYSPDRFADLVAESPFRTADITTEGMALEVRMTARTAASPGR
jgi:hypothetical protein